MVFLREDQDALFALAGEASESLGLRQSWVEKDFWITELLRSVSKETSDVYTVFKGGTSLSKVFGLTKRFSQDVDILVVVTTPKSDQFGDGSIDKRLKEITARASDDLGLEAHTVTSSKGEKRYSTYTYPTRIPEDDISRDVFLEMGTRGSDIPESQALSVRSYISEHLQREDPDAIEEFEELAPLEVRVLAPERTLVEKLALLNALGESYPDDADDLVRAARHVYDIAALLSPGEVRTRLESSPTMIRDLAPEVERISQENFDTATPRPDGGFGESVVFAVGNAACEALRQSYEGNLPSLVYEELRPFDECLEIVRSSAHLL